MEHKTFPLVIFAAFLAGGHVIAQPNAELPAAPAPVNEQWKVTAGPLTLDISLSRTANLFHVVDQISEWSQFCHKQYISYFNTKAGGLSGEDRDLLAEHARIRKTHGWGKGLEQTFYTALDLDAALAEGVKRGLLTEAEARVELRVLLHFRPRVDRLMSEQYAVLRDFAERISGKRELEAFALTMGRFVGAQSLAVPMQLIANPDENSIGGGFNGGVLTLEIPGTRDAYPTLLHEIFHAFIMTKWTLVADAARSVPGLEPETLSEGLAYAYYPGLVHDGSGDVLRPMVAEYMSHGRVLGDSYPRFHAYGLALRPLLKDALDAKQTLEGFLPRAVDAWRVLVELEGARTGGG